MRKQKELIKQHKAQSAICWIGISTDEAVRIKESRVKYVKNRWPLIEAGENRNDCLRWMERNGFPKPPRSACVFCPYHTDREWRRLKTEEPAEFARAVLFERDYQAIKKKNTIASGNAITPFLHASRIPLDQVDFSTEEERGQLNMFNNECEGMCGV
jgi:hypothetical protein